VRTRTDERRGIPVLAVIGAMTLGDGAEDLELPFERALG
jgi:hypothetical protein